MITNEIMIAGPGELGGRPAGEHEDAGADDAADAEENEVQGAQRPLQFAGGELRLDLRDALALEDSAMPPGRPTPVSSAMSVRPQALDSDAARPVWRGR